MIFWGSNNFIYTLRQTDNQTNTQLHNFYRPHALRDALPTMSKHGRHGSRHGNLIGNSLYHNLSHVWYVFANCV